MTPETVRYLDKALECVANARISLTVNLTNDAGRSAYLAAFPAAQALIFERTGKVSKSHQGVHTEFARLAKDDSQLDAALPRFLQRGYNLKAVADYETGPDSVVATERATAAIEGAHDFVVAIRIVLSVSG